MTHGTHRIPATHPQADVFDSLSALEAMKGLAQSIPSSAIKSVGLNGVRLDELTSGTFAVIGENGELVEQSHTGLVEIGNGTVTRSIEGLRACAVCREDALYDARLGRTPLSLGLIRSLFPPEELELTALDGIWVCQAHTAWWTCNDGQEVVVSADEYDRLRGGAGLPRSHIDNR